MSFIDDFLKRPEYDGFAERIFKGFSVSPYIKEIARVRLETLIDYPYLYKGDFNNEVEYLERTYLSSMHSCFLLYISGSGVVGGIGITPLDTLADEIKEPFIINGMDTSKYMYIGEGTLLKSYRGRGMFKNMLSFAEKQAKAAGKKYATFLYVERETTDSFKISGNSIWKEYGYYKNINEHIEQKWMRSDTGKFEVNKLYFWEKPL